MQAAMVFGRISQSFEICELSFRRFGQNLRNSFLSAKVSLLKVFYFEEFFIQNERFARLKNETEQQKCILFVKVYFYACLLKVVTKRPASPFALFFQEKSKSLKQENPQMSQKDIMKIASGMWRNSATYEQQRYKDMFEDNLSTYRKTVKVCMRVKFSLSILRDSEIII